MSSRSRILTYLPFVIGIFILFVILLLAPWEEIGKLSRNIPVSTFFILIGLSALYYGSKAARFWYILHILDIHVPFLKTALLYLSCQTVSVLPAGELYRSVALKKHFGISMSKSAPSVTIQGLVEAIVLLLFSLTGALVVGQSRSAVIIVGALLFALIIVLRYGWLGNLHGIVNRIPFITIKEERFQQFIKSHQNLLSAKNLLPLLAFSLIPVLSGVIILFLSSRAVGFPISFIESSIGYSLPVVVSGLSFLPGGLGVSEGGSIGILQLFDASTAAAVTITLLLRIFTLVAGLLFGTVAQIILFLREKSR